MKEFFFKYLPYKKITDMLSSNCNLSLFSKLMTVLNKEDWQSMKLEL